MKFFFFLLQECPSNQVVVQFLQICRFTTRRHASFILSLLFQNFQSLDVTIKRLKTLDGVLGVDKSVFKLFVQPHLGVVEHCVGQQVFQTQVHHFDFFYEVLILT
jgi:hypothetical protein